MFSKKKKREELVDVLFCNFYFLLRKRFMYVLLLCKEFFIVLDFFKMFLIVHYKDLELGKNSCTTFSYLNLGSNLFASGS